MSYGIFLWGCPADVNTILFVLQKRVVRAIYNMGARESIRNKLKEKKHQIRKASSSGGLLPAVEAEKVFLPISP